MKKISTTQAKYIYVSPLKEIHKVKKQLTDEQGVFFETNEGNFDISECLLLYNINDVKKCKEQLNAVIKF